MTEVVTRTEFLVPEPAHALGALLGVPVPDLGRAGLPLLWHWIYLLDRPAQGDLGPDGHPMANTVPAPPAPGRRRMWAGGRVRAPGALRCGEPATKRTKVLSVQEKHGRSGSLTFVVVGHEIEQSGQVVVAEEQDIVYREAATGPSAQRDDGPVVPPADDEWPLEVSPTLLFRFSALTYNGHRIHYDRDYAREAEGYPGLVTHGPLQAVAMAEAARAQGYGGGSFEYRLISPLFDHQGLVARAVPDGDSVATTVRDRHGRQTATGTLRKLG
ncbi:FAS1-like dehydratase domain-containing protein [Amycolatopsis alkalitolerans]|uniref:Mesaconyl-C4 CoA hydratase n=1 Tax=Amycolatopsis alkalitolerans TaxID=2547244 RepID=A0A5C4M3M4_9PSEU|nr:MaoC family dehydratase N-terminal domain-containing protein [Amycolatopsis alkalitolerans]TNC25715.1 mesaconyl-C4 CoA hydratase [Amycolatopsis alkalitolerans]